QAGVTNPDRKVLASPLGKTIVTLSPATDTTRPSPNLGTRTAEPSFQRNEVSILWFASAGVVALAASPTDAECSVRVCSGGRRQLSHVPHRSQSACSLKYSSMTLQRQNPVCA